MQQTDANASPLRPIMGKITNAHDSFLRELLADKQVAIAYFKESVK